MQIKHEFPPNIKDIEKVLKPSDTAMFCYGDTIYSPHLKQIDTAYIMHETMHSMQQRDKPQEWWDKYLKDPEFRLVQELEAYQVQHRFNVKSGLGRDAVALRLSHMAQALSSEMYGNVISYAEAARKIRELSTTK
jgi:O6-methylguanine-DNA--protein-cysteine methyltransferase